jgi:MPBQ/MSBQ methyltransferase
VSLDDLAPIDEFHIRGWEATKELAEEIGLHAEKLVLDIGWGLGGASRRLASGYSCRVIGLDLTEEYCRAAEALSTRLRLQALVSYRTGNALALPFDDTSFDVVWIQHASMNIGQKARLYGEIPVCNGVYANASTLEDCREQLEEVLEEWILFRVSRNLPLPVIDGIEITIKEVA